MYAAHSRTLETGFFAPAPTEGVDLFERQPQPFFAKHKARPRVATVSLLAFDECPDEYQAVVGDAARDEYVPTIVVEAPVGTPVVVDVKKSRVTKRLRMLKRLSAGHDGCNAPKPKPESFDAALAFLPSILTTKDYGVTVNDDGFAVFEFEDDERGLFADLTFHGDAQVDFYRRMRGVPSVFLTAQVGTDHIAGHLREAGIIA